MSMQITHTILLVEDDEQQRDIISQILNSADYQVTAVSSVEEAILALKQSTYDAIFSDWKLGTLTGLDLLNWVRKHRPEIGFAVATAYGTIAHAVKAMKSGADDYLAKPFQRQELLICVEKILKASELRRQNLRLNHALSEQQRLVDLVGSSANMQKVFERIERVSNTTATILITGESGTGKELAARALHQLSGRQSSPFIAVNCGAIPESIAEAELFGAQKGAYTGADDDKVGKLQAAEQGTLFLDEIGELPPNLQTQLLRFLQEGTITPLGSTNEIRLDVRVVAATHRDLQAMVQNGEFREDLYYRLNIVPIHMPPLRERADDIPQLIDYFLNKSATHYAVERPSPSKQTLKRLLEYHWPGNVRELSNRIERYVLLNDEAELVPNQTNSNVNLLFTIPDEGLNWEAFEKQCLGQAMQKCQNNRTKAAKLMGLSYKAFVYRLEKHGLN